MHLFITTGQPSPPTTKIMMNLQVAVPFLLVDQTGINTVRPHSFLLQLQPIQQTLGVSKISFLFSPLHPDNLLYCMFMPGQTNPAAQKFIVTHFLSVSINQ